MHEQASHAPPDSNARPTTPPPSRARRGARRLDRYDLMARVAEGGMGEVHLALRRGSRDFRRWVAVKLMHPDVVGPALYLEMFEREARLAARLDDPHICAVHDFGETDGTHFLVMEYLHGQSLGDVLARMRTPGLPPRIAARIVADAARGLHAAHTHRDDDGAPLPVVHRDVSPQNLFVLYSGTTKVVDFGIARPAGHDQQLTRTGEVRGKVAYMAPEQLRGHTPSPSMDVWALGVVLWECLTGRRLFREATDAETITRVLEAPIPTPRAVRAALPGELDAITLRALSRDPASRYASALDLARDLEAFVTPGGDDGRDAVAAYLTSTFAAEKSARERLLRTLARDDAAPDRDAPPPPAPEPSPEPLPTRAHPRAQRTPPTLALALGAAALGLLAGAWIRSRAQTPAAQHAAPAPPPAALAAQAPPVAAPPVAVAPTLAPAATSPTRPPPHRSRTAHVPRPPDEPSAPPATAPQARTGRLSLRASAPAQVFVGDRRLGHTPLVGVTLPIGRHTLRVVPDDGSETEEVDVEIEPSAESSVALRR